MTHCSSYSKKPDPFRMMAIQNGAKVLMQPTGRENQLGVVLNCDTQSSFLKLLVKAFERLHIVLAANSGYGGSKYSRRTSESRLLGASSCDQ
jgi:hypothetical protein